MSLCRRVVPVLSCAALIGLVYSASPARSMPQSARGGFPFETQAQTSLCNNTFHRFTGYDASGNFQAALEDARVQADVFFSQQPDLRYDYRVLGTTGQRGGFVFFNDIFVEILVCEQ
jgi:hypothetical protein